MRDHLLLSVNGTLQRVAGEDAFETLSAFLRERLRLTGTKVVCAEGDCGVCTVLIAPEAARAAGEPAPPLEWRSVDSCIVHLHQLDACHVLSIEGLGVEGLAVEELGVEDLADARAAELHPVQRAMIECFGSQCGFCTPGFVVALAGLAERARRAGDARLDRHVVRRELTGNLCRCTGYVQILEAADAVAVAACGSLEERIPPAARAALAAAALDEVRVTGEAGRAVLVPASLERAVAELAARPGARIVAGATDLAVRSNKGRLEPRDVVQLGRRIAGFEEVAVDGDPLAGGRLRAGAGASWSAVLDAVRAPVPELAAILERFGAPQIRNLGTVGGNLANASPIADSLPFFYVMGAELEIRGPAGARRVEVADFYRGYKDTALGPGELIAAVESPLPAPGEVLRLRKLSRRRDLDISSVTAAFRLSFDGARIERARIERARIAFGGVGPVVLRTPRTEGLLRGRRLDLELARRAGRLAREEVSPITDVRGAAGYRARLVENLFVELAHELAPAARAAGG